MIIANDGIILNYDDSLMFNEIKNITIQEYVSLIFDKYGKSYIIGMNDAIKLIKHASKEKEVKCQLKQG